MAQDGTQDRTDSKLGAGTTQTPKTYTEEEHTKLVTEAKTSALADVGRLRAEASKALTAATAAEARIKAIEQAREEAEQEAARDDPPELRRIRAEQAKKRAESELAEAKQELNEKNELLKQRDAERVESTKERNAREIATRLNVDPVRLAKLAKFTDGTPEAIEDIAKDLPNIGEKRTPLISDSGRGSGGKGGLTVEAVKGMSTEQILANYKEIAKLPLA